MQFTEDQIYNLLTMLKLSLSGVWGGLFVSFYYYFSDTLSVRVAVDNIFKTTDHLMMVVGTVGFQARLLALQPVFCGIQLDSL